MIKVANVVGRYILFYLSIVFLFTAYSTLLDYYYFWLDYASTSSYKPLPMTYAVYFGIGYLFPVLPIAIFYNYLINSIFINSYIRLIIGLLVGVLIGFLVHENGISFYIGHLRPIKNIVLYGLIGVTVELLRNIKHKYNKNRSH